MNEIIRPGRNCWRVADVSTTGLLVDGRDYYRAFYCAAKKARNYILISGWQFDSNVTLLRGKDAKVAGEEPALLSFLNDLCERNRALRIFWLFDIPLEPAPPSTLTWWSSTPASARTEL